MPSRTRLSGLGTPARQQLRCQVEAQSTLTQQDQRCVATGTLALQATVTLSQAAHQLQTRGGAAIYQRMAVFAVLEVAPLLHVGLLVVRPRVAVSLATIAPRTAVRGAITLNDVEVACVGIDLSRQ